MSAPVQQQSINPVASWRVAIIDDVYAGPTRDAVKNGLAEFCAEVSADDSLAKLLSDRTQCDFANISNVTDAGIVALFNCRGQLTEIAEKLERLFLEFDQRRNEVVTIEQNLKDHGFADANIKTFQSVEDLFSGEPFQLVFLDLLLAKGEAESQAIAKDIYNKFKAFILLMSNSPIANPQQIEGFRRATRLLNGFFTFQAKADLCDVDKFRVQIETLPKNPEVCHALHDFVIALEDALGGAIEEPPIGEIVSPGGATLSILPQFMHTLRALGLNDYALLCEMTLRNEGHPLGDYMMRLLGAHLLAHLQSNMKVRHAIEALDKLRFTEFLPFDNTHSPSFHRMYADATTETITGPWGAHPWSSVTPTATSESCAEDIGSDAIGETQDSDESASEELVRAIEEPPASSELMSFLEIQDDGRKLPYVQLGDLFIKDEETLVFAVLSASCELQFVPTHVHRDRERKRDDTVLLVPGRMRPVGTKQISDTQTTAGLVEWKGTVYCIDWFDGKLVGLPHCSLRKLLQDRGYLHHRRLQTPRALELQQAIMSNLSRIGVEVRPPFPRDIKIVLHGRREDQVFTPLGEPITQAGVLFHGRKHDERLLVLRIPTYYEFLKRIDNYMTEAERIGTSQQYLDALRQAIHTFKQNMIGMKRPVVLPNSSDVSHLAILTRTKKPDKIDRIGIRFGTFQAPPELNNRDSKKIMLCLSAEEE